MIFWDWCKLLMRSMLSRQLSEWLSVRMSSLLSSPGPASDQCRNILTKFYKHNWPLLQLLLLTQHFYTETNGDVSLHIIIKLSPEYTFCYVRASKIFKWSVCFLLTEYSYLACLKIVFRPLIRIIVSRWLLTSSKVQITRKEFINISSQTQFL